MGCGVGQRGSDRRLAEAIAPRRLCGVASSVGGGANIVMDRPEQEDEQRLRAVVCERRGIRICCHDSPDDEAARSCLRAFHTASLRGWVNRPLLVAPTCPSARASHEGGPLPYHQNRSSEAE